LIADPIAFIRAETRLRPVPHAPEIRLHVADEATDLWQKTEEELGTLGLPPPFWAFAWAGGQALARYILDHPETVRGRTVLDFASGSGLVAIAAAKAGAGEVSACDIDAFALAAIGLNAEANGVAIGALQADLVGQDPWLGHGTRRRHLLRAGHRGARRRLAPDPGPARGHGAHR
jgi:predicted nicotinamide N-methyase